MKMPIDKTGHLRMLPVLFFYKLGESLRVL